MSPLAQFVYGIFGVAPTNPSPTALGSPDIATVTSPVRETSPAILPSAEPGTNPVTHEELLAYLRAGSGPITSTDPDFFDKKAAFFERVALEVPPRESARARSLALGARNRAAFLRSAIAEVRA